MDPIQEILENSIRFIQLIFFPVFGFIILIGCFFYLFSSKNPFRRRKAYLFTIFGSIGALLVLYLPLVFMYFKDGKEPHEPTGDETLTEAVNSTQSWGEVVFNLLKVLLEPMIFFGGYAGIAIWLLAAKNPPRKRIGMGMVFGAPIMWILLQYTPDIYHFFVPSNPQ